MIDRRAIFARLKAACKARGITLVKFYEQAGLQPRGEELHNWMGRPPSRAERIAQRCLDWAQELEAGAPVTPMPPRHLKAGKKTKKK